MPTGEFLVVLKVKAHWLDKTDPLTLFADETEWLGNPKSRNGCVVESKFHMMAQTHLVKLPKGTSYGTKS